MKNPKHVLQYFNTFTFKLTVNGDRVLPDAWWPTKNAASFYAELSKWFYRASYGLDHHTVRIAPHFTPDSLSVEAASRGINLTASPAEILQYLPKGIQRHVDRFGGELQAMAALNLDTGYNKTVTAVLSNLRKAVSAVSQGIDTTTGDKREFLERALPILTEYANSFESTALAAAQPSDIKP